MTGHGADVLVVGAGLAGAAAAHALTSAGHRVRVTERAAVPGGRMGSLALPGGVADHGAQFFTTRSEEFTAIVGRALADGAVVTWTNGFDDPPDGYPRYRGATGMGDLARWLLADADVSVTYGSEITHIDRGPDAVILTAPVPESLALLTNSDLLPEPALHQRLGSIAYKPTIAVLLTLDRSPDGFPDHGGVQYLDHPELAFATDNGRKGLTEGHVVTVHLTNELSGRLWNAADAHIVDQARAACAGLLGDAAAQGSQVIRWRYAGPVETLPERTIGWGSEPFIALAGEAFGGPKVEGAFLSGRAAATLVGEHLDLGAARDGNMAS